MEDRCLKLESEAPDGDFSRFDIEVFIPVLEAIPETGVYLEIGVNKGRSLWVARQLTKKNVVVIGVDLRPDPVIPGTIFCQGDSVKIATHFAGKIDVLFIDGDHSYEGCKRDIEAWYPYLREHGVILFHDCDESSPGVMWAVGEFASTHKCTLLLFKYENKNTSMAKIQL